jgi:Gnt-I system low-affinity gluconate transporter
MSVPELILITAASISLLLLLVLRFKVHAFLALILVSILVGIFTGMDLEKILVSIQEGMASTLGYIAVVVGLGAIFGEVLQVTGGMESLAKSMLSFFGEKRASWAMMVTGFLVAIPVFLDVGFIILVPMVFALARKSSRSVLYYAIPMLAGLAVTHAFVPPTPGPIAVAQIIDAPLGLVIMAGIIIGIPTAIISGPVFGNYISKKIFVPPPPVDQGLEGQVSLNAGKGLSIRWVLSLIGLPLLLIILRSILELGEKANWYEPWWFMNFLKFLGHPFVALLLATLFAGYFLGSRQGIKKDQMMKIANAALSPAGLIILITGAGGVFKQVLVDSGVGVALARIMITYQLSPIVLAYILAAIIRVTQGSATVAMITSAGMIAPVLMEMDITDIHKSLIVIAIASGATILSHVNDSGFWLIGKYLNMTENQTLRSWSVMETIVSLSSFLFILIVASILL